MAQGYVSSFPPDSGEQFENFPAKTRTNQSAINTWHKGATAPTNPETGQPWIDDSVSPWLLKMWDGATWQLVGQVLAPFAEVVTARGSTASLDARLSVSLNPDGTLKVPTTLNPSEWLQVAGTTTRLNATQFTIGTTDLTAIFHANRRVRLNPGPAYGTVVGSSFGAGTTTVTLAESVVPIGLSSVDAAILSAVAASASVNARSIPSPSGGQVETYVTEVIGARRGLSLLLQDFDQDPSTTTGLTWGFKAGRLSDGSLKSAGTVTLADNATNYVELDPYTGAVTRRTLGFSTGAVPLRMIVTASGAITNSTDVRPLFVQPAQPEQWFNGDFTYWPGGTSFSTVTPGVGMTLGNNGWWAGPGDGGQITVSREQTQPSDALPIHVRYFLRVQWISGGGGSDPTFLESGEVFGIPKREGVRKWQGKTIRFSYWARSSLASGHEITPIMWQSFGSGGGATPFAGPILGQAVQLNQSWQQFFDQIALPTITSDKVVGSTDDDYLGFGFNINSRGFTVDLADIRILAID